MKRGHEEVLPSMALQIPLDIWVEMFKNEKNPLTSLLVLSQSNQNLYNLLSLYVKGQMLLSYGIQQIALSNKVNFTYFLDTLGRVFIYGNYRFYYDHLIPTDENPLTVKNEYPYHLTHLTSLTNIVEIIAANDSFESIFFRNIHGQVFACGENFSGELGIGNSRLQYDPQELTTLQNIKRVVSEDGSTFFLNENGRVFACGDNEHGQLGVGNTENQNYPIELHTLENIEHIMTASNSTFFMNMEGAVFVSGANQYGQLGIGNTLNLIHPIEFTGVKNVKQVVSKYGSTFFLDQDNQVFACGYNEFGQLGVGNTVNQNCPIQLVSLENIVQIISNFENTFFRDKKGQVFACGKNVNGRLGVGNTENQCLPVKLTELTNIRHMICGEESFFFIDKNNQVFAHGENQWGQLGIGNTEDQNQPIKLTELNNIEHIVLDHRLKKCKSTFFLNTNHQVFACGANGFKNLGIVGSDKNTQSSPTQLNTIPEIKQIIAQQGCTFFIDVHHQAYASGDNTYGQLGLEIGKVLNGPALIPFFAKQREEHILRLARKWDINTLENLVKDKASYRDLCHQVLTEKLAMQKEDACMNTVECSSIQLERGPVF